MSIRFDIDVNINGEATADVLVHDEDAGQRLKRRLNLRNAVELDTFVDDVEGGFGPEAAGDARTMLDDAAKKAATEPAPLAIGIRPECLTIAALHAAFPALKPVVIHNLFRLEEIINLIGSSKTMKTWLAQYLGLCVATGRAFLDHYRTVQGRVLYLDNELHQATAAHRLMKILGSMNLTPEDVGDNFVIENFRGRLITIDELDGYLRNFPPGHFSLIIVDALYKFLPDGTDENDNGMMARLYCRLDQFAKLTGSAMLVIHHASKGIQGSKAVTDVGSGAGAISRSADSHLVMRPHETDGVAVMEGETRSFEKLTPFCIRWDFPRWVLAPDEDPTQLKIERGGRGGRPRKGEEKAAKETPHEWTAAEFVTAFVSDEPKPKELILAKAGAAGIGQTTARNLLMLAIDGKSVHRHQLPGDNKAYFATREQTLVDMSVCVSRAPHTPRVRRSKTSQHGETSFRDTHTHAHAGKGAA